VAALENAVVVVTGASSGIGRAVARRLARRGASLALGARGPEALAQVAGECEASGSPVLWRSTDVCEEEAVERLAVATEDRFGRIDVWVNNASVIAYGPFEEIPSEVFRRVVETNLMGQVHGARAALRRFRAQGSGVLINVSSVWGRITSPQVTPYVVSKNAVRAFSECLHSELAGEPAIHVATIVPQAVDTPIFEHGANYSGHLVRPIPPVLPADEIAAGIEACAESPKREVNYGRWGRGLEVLYAAAPGLYRRLAHPAFVRGSFGWQPRPPSPGNVLESREPHTIDGAWRSRHRPTLRRAFLAATLGAAAGLAGRGRAGT
jgi:NAD(P)-dependent dehydrogenase (short-subunit alcohol dehydrogenase family)